MKKILVLLLIALLCLTSCSAAKIIKIDDENWFDDADYINMVTYADTLLANKINGYSDQDLLGMEAYYTCSKRSEDEMEALYAWYSDHQELLLHLENVFELYRFDCTKRDKKQNIKYSYTIGSGEVQLSKHRSGDPNAPTALYLIPVPDAFSEYADFELEDGMCLVIRSVAGDLYNIDTYEVYRTKDDAAAAQNCLYSTTLEDYEY